MAQHKPLTVTFDVGIQVDGLLGLIEKQAPRFITSRNLDKLCWYLPMWARQFRSCYPSPNIDDYYQGIKRVFDAYSDEAIRAQPHKEKGWFAFLSSSEVAQLTECNDKLVDAQNRYHASKNPQDWTR